MISILHIKMVKKYFGELGLSFAHLEDLAFLFPSYCDTSRRGHPCPILEPASPHGVIRVMGLADCCPHHSAHLGRAALTVGAMPLLSHCHLLPFQTTHSSCSLAHETQNSWVKKYFNCRGIRDFPLCLSGCCLWLSPQLYLSGPPSFTVLHHLSPSSAALFLW